MKRVHLWINGQPDMGIIRLAAITLARYAVNNKECNLGDPIHEEVTEGRRMGWEDSRRKGREWAQKGMYSSCGDLPHWMYFKLGCREHWINRQEFNGWKSVVNISRLVFDSKAYVRAEDGEPLPGDVLYVDTPGVDNSGHVCVLVERLDEDTWITADFGQPYGKLQVCKVIRRNEITFVRSRRLKGFLDLAAIRLTDSALLPDDFEHGVLDDNPYRD